MQGHLASIVGVNCCHCHTRQGLPEATRGWTSGPYPLTRGERIAFALGESGAARRLTQARSYTVVAAFKLSLCARQWARELPSCLPASLRGEEGEKEGEGRAGSDAQQTSRQRHTQTAEDRRALTAVMYVEGLGFSSRRV